MMELVLFSPWIFLLFIGALDWGFYASALNSLESATRSAVLYTSSSPSTADATSTACSIVLDELRKLANIGSSTTTCGSNPAVTAVKLTNGPGNAAASRVTVTYTSVSLIPIPGLLKKQFTARNPRAVQHAISRHLRALRRLGYSIPEVAPVPVG